MAPKPIDVTIRGKDTTKPAFDSAIKSADSFGARIKASINSPLTVAKGAGIALAATIGTALVRAVGAFARASVESAAAADAAWGRVESAVSGAGMKFDAARGKLDRLFTSIQATTRYSDDDAADAFATLVNISGDYTRSLDAMTLVTDVAAAKKMSLASAAELVGKVLAGETGHLKRLGIVIHEGDDAMEALRRQFTGFAERDGKTLEGQLAKIANAWDNLKESVGRAFTSIDASGNVTNRLVNGLNEFGGWIEANKGKLQLLFDLLTGVLGLMWKVGSFVVSLPKNVNDLLVSASDDARPVTTSKGVVWVKPGKRQQTESFQSVQEFSQGFSAENAQFHKDRAARDKAEREKAAHDAESAATKKLSALKTEFELLKSLSRLGELTVQQKDRQLQIERQIAAIAGDKSASIANRASAADFTADLAEQRRRALESFDPNAKIPIGYTPMGVAKTPIPLHIGAAPIAAGVPSLPGFNQGLSEAFQDAAGITGPLDEALGTIEERLQNLTGGAMADFFDAWQQGIQDVIQGNLTLGELVPRVVRRAAGAALAADAQDTLLRAAKALALALTDPSGLHALQAGRLFAIGSAELAAAAALSGGGGRGGAAGGGISAGGFQQSQSEIGGGRKTSVILKGKGINFNNPDDLEALRAALLELGETRDIEFVVVE